MFKLHMLTPSPFIQARAYHAGSKYYVEVDIVMDENTPLKISHDVSQALQRKLEGEFRLGSDHIPGYLLTALLVGLSDVERAFVHVDYEHDHDPHKEHKPLYEKKESRSLKEIMQSAKKKMGSIMPGNSSS